MTKILISRWTPVCQNITMLGPETVLYGVEQYSAAARRRRLAPSQGSRAGLKNPDGRIFREIKILPRLGQDCLAHRKAWQDFFFVASAGRGRGWIFFAVSAGWGAWQDFFRSRRPQPSRAQCQDRAVLAGRGVAGFFRPQRNKNPTTPRARFSGSPGGVAGFFFGRVSKNPASVAGFYARQIKILPRSKKNPATPRALPGGSRG